jgi:hypothetical protein
VAKPGQAEPFLWERKGSRKETDFPQAENPLKTLINYEDLIIDAGSDPPAGVAKPGQAFGCRPKNGGSNPSPS